MIESLRSMACNIICIHVDITGNFPSKAESPPEVSTEEIDKGGEDEREITKGRDGERERERDREKGKDRGERDREVDKSSKDKTTAFSWISTSSSTRAVFSDDLKIYMAPAGQSGKQNKAK